MPAHGPRITPPSAGSNPGLDQAQPGTIAGDAHQASLGPAFHKQHRCAGCRCVVDLVYTAAGMKLFHDTGARFGPGRHHARTHLEPVRARYVVFHLGQMAFCWLVPAAY